MIEIDQTVLIVVISLTAVVLAGGIILAAMLFKLNRELQCWTIGCPLHNGGIVHLHHPWNAQLGSQTRIRWSNS